MPKYELFGTASCPYTVEAREWLEFNNHDYAEYDVDADPVARARMMEIANGRRSVPVLVEDGKLVQIGWQGRACIV